MRSNFLVFSDTHITPAKYNTLVLEEIRKAIIKGRPDYIICTGDLGEFASQNRLVKDRGSYSLAEELTAVVAHFRHYIVDTVKMIQQEQRKNKKKMYRPLIACCMGNHEAAIQDQLMPLLDSIGVVCVPHKMHLTINDIVFCHTFDDGVSGKPCTSTEQILRQTMSRTVSGHSHVRSITEDRDVHGYKVFAIKLPCANMSYPDWTPQGSIKWDRGFLWLTAEEHSDWFQYVFREVEDEAWGKSSACSSASKTAIQ